jgi:membrane dipeptidase
MSPVRIDGHLDLAYNALALGRDLALELDDLRERERRTRETAMVTWPELRRADVAVVFGTLFAKPDKPPRPGAPPASDRAFPGYRDAEGAHAQARAQLDWYEAAEDAGHARLIRSRADLEAHLVERTTSDPARRRTGVVVLMEGADPVRTPDELEHWFARGVRLLGPAWSGTRYCGGTREPGGLTPLGEELMDAMSALSLPLDVSHLAEEAFWQALARHRGPVLASHANARALTPTDRHLSDAMLDALADGTPSWAWSSATPSSIRRPRGGPPPSTPSPVRRPTWRGASGGRAWRSAATSMAASAARSRPSSSTA